MSTFRPVRGGWWHDHVCPTHGTELGPPADGAYPCPHGCLLTGDRYDGAWAVIEHQAWARRLRLLVRQPENLTEAMAEIRAAATFYQQLPARWSERSADWMLRGKLFAQGLTEAIWAVQVADAVLVVADHAEMPDEWVDGTVGLLTGLLDTVASAREILVTERGEHRNNYTAWLDAAGSLTSLALAALGHPADPRPWRTRLADHLAAATGDDGWEWEGATYYHLFVLRAYLLGLRGSDPSALDRELTGRLGRMVRVLAQIAGPDGRLPVLHDGPYDRVPAHLELLEVCRLAARMWERTGLERVESWVRARIDDHDGLEDLLDGWFTGERLPDLGPDRGSVLFEDVGYAVLRDAADSWQAVVDVGPHGGSHGHLDTLGLYLAGRGAEWQPPPGVPPYGSALRRGYYARSVAHPVVRVGDADQHPSAARVEHWETSDDGAHLVASSDEAVDGTRVVREVILRGPSLIDVVHVDRHRAADDAGAPVVLGLRPGVAFTVRAEGDRWRSTWTPEDGATLHGLHLAVTGAEPDDTAAVTERPGRGPSDDPSRPVQVGEWTSRAARVCFVSVYATAPPRAATVAVGRTQATLTVTSEDGSAAEHSLRHPFAEEP